MPFVMKFPEKESNFAWIDKVWIKLSSKELDFGRWNWAWCV